MNEQAARKKAEEIVNKMDSFYESCIPEDVNFPFETERYKKLVTDDITAALLEAQKVAVCPSEDDVDAIINKTFELCCDHSVQKRHSFRCGALWLRSKTRHISEQSLRECLDALEVLCGHALAKQQFQHKESPELDQAIQTTRQALQKLREELRDENL